MGRIDPRSGKSLVRIQKRIPTKLKKVVRQLQIAPPTFITEPLPQVVTSGYLQIEPVETPVTIITTTSNTEEVIYDLEWVPKVEPELINTDAAPISNSDSFTSGYFTLQNQVKLFQQETAEHDRSYPIGLKEIPEEVEVKKHGMQKRRKGKKEVV